MLADGGVELVAGHGRFVDGPHVVVNGQRLSARHFIIATGASPVRDSIAGIATCPTSDDLLDLTSLPERAAIVGGGYIAVEFASMLARLGVQVTLLYRDRLPLRGFDEDLRTRLAAALHASRRRAASPARRRARVGGAVGRLAADVAIERRARRALGAQRHRPPPQHGAARPRCRRHRHRREAAR